MVSVAAEVKALYGDEMKMKALMDNMVRDCTIESILCFVEVSQFKNHVISTVDSQNVQFDEKTVVRHRVEFFEHCPQSSIVFSNELCAAISHHAVELEAVSEAEEDEVEEDNAVDDAGRVSEVNHGRDDQDQQPEDDRLRLNQRNVARFKQSAHALFKKYIKEGADWQINISGGHAQHFQILDESDYVDLSPSDWIKLYDSVMKSVEVYILQSHDRMIVRLHREEQRSNAAR